MSVFVARASAALSIASVVISTGTADAAFVPVDLSANINADIRTYTSGGVYPAGGQTLAFGGVPFSLGLRFDDPLSLGAVQTNGVNTPETYSFSVNVPDAVRLFTLINSGFGAFVAYNGRVEVFGTGGAYAAFDLVQGFNIRDHFENIFQNIITDATVVPTDFGLGARLDRQVLQLGPAFIGQTATEVRFTGGPVSSFTDGVAFLAGATFEQVPAPGPAALVATAGLVAVRRRRRNA